METMKKLLLVLKPLNSYPNRQTKGITRITNPQFFDHLDSRRKVHQAAVKFCRKVLRQKSVICETMLRTDLKQPVYNFDLVITVGGDGTLLQTSHFMDDLIPILGVNSDPTQVEEVEKFSDEFDATRSAGYLCAATTINFEKVLDDILEGRKAPLKLSRISVVKNSKVLSPYALNDVLLAHPCPASVSRFSFKVMRDGESCTRLAHSRSSGLRVSTAAGSTAAMLSAGGFAMPVLSQDLQYKVREPILPGAAVSSLMHGIIKSDQSMEVVWSSKKGAIYTDGPHVSCPIQYGDTIEISSKAPVLKVFLPCHAIGKTHSTAKPCVFHLREHLWAAT